MKVKIDIKRKNTKFNDRKKNKDEIIIIQYIYSIYNLYI